MPARASGRTTSRTRSIVTHPAAVEAPATAPESVRRPLRTGDSFPGSAYRGRHGHVPGRPEVGPVRGRRSSQAGPLRLPGGRPGTSTRHDVPKPKGGSHEDKDRSPSRGKPLYRSTWLGFDLSHQGAGILSRPRFYSSRQKRWTGSSLAFSTCSRNSRRTVSDTCFASPSQRERFSRSADAGARPEATSYGPPACPARRELPAEQGKRHEALGEEEAGLPATPGTPRSARWRCRAPAG